MYSKLQYTIVFAVVALMLGACASLGIPTADTFNERLAAGYSLNTAVRRASIDLMNAKKITGDDGDNVLKANDAARAGLDVARTISKTDLNAADAKLTAVRTTLVALQAYLASRGGK